MPTASWRILAMDSTWLSQANQQCFMSHCLQHGSKVSHLVKSGIFRDSVAQ